MTTMDVRVMVFAEAFLRARGDTQAAYTAAHPGCSEAAAQTKSAAFLRRWDVQQWLMRGLADAMKKFKISADRILQELAALAFLDPVQLFTPEGVLLPLDQMPEEARRALAGLEVAEIFGAKADPGQLRKIKLNDKLAALRLLGQTMAMFTEKQTVTVEQGPKVTQVSLEERVKAISTTGTPDVKPFG